MVNIETRKSEKLQDKNSAFVTFDYNPLIVGIMRSLPFRFYNANKKEWEIPVNKVETVLKELDKLGITANVNVDVEDKKLIDIKFKTTPYQYQLEGIEYGMLNQRWLLGDEQGLGKTLQVINIAVNHKYRDDYKHCLIVCGVNSLKWNWKNEIVKHSYESGYILGERKKKLKITVGGNKEKLEDLELLLKEPSRFPYFIITNVESMRNKDIAEKLKKAVDKGIINMCACDEIHKLKNPSSQQTKGFLKLQPECRIAMSGTPIMNNPLDVFIILKWLGYESHPYYAFKKYYCQMGGFGGYEVIGYKHLDELKNKVNDIMLRRLKSDVLDLPEKVYIDEVVDMLPKQAQVYKDVEANIKSNLDLLSTSINPLAVLIRLRQATGYTGILSSSIQESAKLDRLEELVENAVENNNKCVIFSNWTSMTDVIKQKLKQYNPAIITGETKDDERTAQQDKFMLDNTCKVIIGTIGAMGTGLTLTAGNTVIFLDEPWNKALFDQAVDRCHRIGTKSTVFIYSIMCKDTIDERIHELIYKKGKIAEAMLDNGKMSKTELLNYLLS